MSARFESLPECVRLESFGYLSIQDLGKVSQTCGVLRTEVADDFLWRQLYPTTFTHAKDAIPVDVQSLVNRPYRRNSVGWSVSVLHLGTDTWLTGIVLEYRNELFLVHYDLDDREEWERETMTGGAWFTAGKLRIRFLSPPGGVSEPSLIETKRSRPRAPSVADELDTQLGTSVDSRQRRKRPLNNPSPLASPRVCVTSNCAPHSPGSHSWRCEAFRDRMMAPTRLLSELKAHTDEVLCVAFSTKGDRLASCSRDGSTRIFLVTDAEHVEETVAIHHAPGSVPCRVSWSSDDSMLLVSTEARNGNIFDYDAHVVVFDSKSGKRLIERTNIPFDVCAAWIPDTHVFVHGESLTVSPRGTYHQALALWDMDAQRVLGRFHFRFSGEAFIHLIQVSPDGQLLAVTCGVGDALSDTVRIVRIPDITPLLESRGSFEIRVPRSKFTAELLMQNADLNGRRILNAQSVAASKLISVASPCSDADSVVPSFFCGGAVLGLAWSKDSRRFYTNTRLYLSCVGASCGDEVPASTLTDRPDLDNTLEIQEWAIEGNDLVSRMKGAHGFTTKDCPFYLFLAESPCGDYIASGSEDCGVYVYNVRHRRLMRVLWAGHEDVVSMVSWSPNSILATASDDKKICLWGSSLHAKRDLGAKRDVPGDMGKSDSETKRQRTVSRSG